LVKVRTRPNFDTASWLSKSLSQKVKSTNICVCNNKYYNTALGSMNSQYKWLCGVKVRRWTNDCKVIRSTPG